MSIFASPSPDGLIPVKLLVQATTYLSALGVRSARPLPGLPKGKSTSTQAAPTAMDCPALAPLKILQLAISGLQGIKSALP